MIYNKETIIGHELEVVKEYGMSIKYIKNLSEEIQLEAVKQNGKAIYFIKNPSEKVQLEVVNKNTL